MSRSSRSGRSRVGGALGRFALVLVSLGLTLGVAEIAARLAWRDVPHRALPKPAGALPRLRPDELRRPDLSGLVKGVFYRTNAAGLRGPDYTRKPAPGTFRIAIAGDSVVAAAGVDEEDAYPRVLERLLGAQGLPGAGSTQRFEVINMGLGGLHAEAVMSRLLRSSAFYEFQLAIYGWTPNDIEGPSYRELGHRARMAFWRQVLRAEDHPSYLVRSLWPRLRGLVARFRQQDVTTSDEVRFNYLENSAAWDDFLAQLDRFARFTQRRGICGHVFVHSRSPELREVHDRVAAAARERGLSVSHAMPAFEGRRPEEFWLSPYDSHHNVEGNVLMAHALLEGLRDQLPRRCWSPRPSDWPEIKLGPGGESWRMKSLEREAQAPAQ